MRYASLFVWALASFLAIDGLTLSPRQLIQRQSVATSFKQVTSTYSTISQSFIQTRQTIQSSTTVEECSSALTQLRSQIGTAVQSISGGCDCEADGVDRDVLQDMITTWFSELKAITTVIQYRFGSSYQSVFSSTFSQISVHMQSALATAYVAGFDVDSIVQRSVTSLNINQRTFASFGIHTSHLTRTSQFVNNRSGVFANSPLVGARFSNSRGGRWPNGSYNFNKPSGSPHKPDHGPFTGGADRGHGPGFDTFPNTPTAPHRPGYGRPPNGAPNQLDPAYNVNHNTLTGENGKHGSNLPFSSPPPSSFGTIGSGLSGGRHPHDTNSLDMPRPVGNGITQPDTSRLLLGSPPTSGPQRSQPDVGHHIGGHP